MKMKESLINNYLQKNNELWSHKTESYESVNNDNNNNNNNNNNNKLIN